MDPQAINTASRSAAPPKREVRGRTDARPIGEAMTTILHKTGVFTPEREAEIAAVQARIADTDRLLHAQRLRAACNTWPRDAHASFNDLELPRARLSRDEFIRYMEVRDDVQRLIDFPALLILSGPPGTGKTRFGAAAVHQFCDAGRGAYFCSAMDYYRGLRSCFGEKGRTAEEYVRRFRSYGLLAIDEIEVRSDSAWENNELRDLVNARHQMELSSIILTNKTVDEIQSYFSAPIRDRIRDGGCVWSCNWPSLRGPR